MFCGEWLNLSATRGERPIAREGLASERADGAELIEGAPSYNPKSVVDPMVNRASLAAI